MLQISIGIKIAFAILSRKNLLKLCRRNWMIYTLSLSLSYRSLFPYFLSLSYSLSLSDWKGRYQRSSRSNCFYNRVSELFYLFIFKKDQGFQIYLFLLSFFLYIYNFYIKKGKNKITSLLIITCAHQIWEPCSYSVHHVFL